MAAFVFFILLYIYYTINIYFYVYVQIQPKIFDLQLRYIPQSSRNHWQPVPIKLKLNLLHFLFF
jgi:hypothetical protein